MKQLNPRQQEAVQYIGSPLLVLAGAGSGKTSVITQKIAWLIRQCDYKPQHIAAVTFTNKAAKEMKNRVESLIGGVVEGMQWLGTFHSVSANILRRHAELVGLSRDFTILDTDDQIRLIKQILEAENIDAKRWPAREFAWCLDRWKNRALTPDQISKSDAMEFAEGRGADLYRLYQARLKSLNAADFGDLLLECIRLFKENPDLAAE